MSNTVIQIKNIIIFLVLLHTSLCDKSFDSIKTRVIGGEVAHINKYTFTAAVTVQTNTSRYFCGGALFKDQWIITAGQCVAGATLFTVQLGSTKLKGEDPNRLTLATSDYILHPDYNPVTLENDIGLIKLRMPIEFTDYIRQLIPLATHQLPAKESLRIIGWGQTTDGNSSLADELQVATVASISNEECKIFYGSQITENMVCIVGNYNEGSCHGDTGSPLIDSYSKYAAINVGIASFVSGNGCESTDPSGYTRVFPYVNWIYDVTK